MLKTSREVSISILVALFGFCRNIVQNSLVILLRLQLFLGPHNSSNAKNCLFCLRPTHGICQFAKPQIWEDYDVVMYIPRIIHQTVENKQQVLSEYESNRQEMSRLNPRWDLKLYTSDDREDFIRSAYDNKILRAYLSIDRRYGAARADFFRYLVILNLGGLYLDIKATSTKPLDTVIFPEDTFIVAQWPKSIDGVDTSSVGNHKEISFREYQNWFVLGAPNHVILEKVVEEILRNIDSYNPFIHGVGKLGVLRTTGPIAYSKVVHKNIKVGGVRVATNKELGLKPTIHTIIDDQTPFPNKQSIPHYSSLCVPIISSSKFSTVIVYIFFKIGHKCKRVIQRIAQLKE